MLIVFDVIGTIFSLDRARQDFADNRLGREMFDVWFARLLHASVAATLAGRFIPFHEAAEASLKQVLAAADKQEDLARGLLESLQELQPWPDAEDCLHELRANDHRLCALTNGETAETNALLRKAGLKDLFEMVLSVNDAGKWKPHPATYQLALKHCGGRPDQSCLVAAHGWDILGAAAIGMQTVWVSRLEKRWPLPGEPPGRIAASLAQVPEMVRGLSL